MRRDEVLNSEKVDQFALVVSNVKALYALLRREFVSPPH